MKAFFSKIKTILAIISGVALIAYVIKIWGDKPLPDDEDFPLADEKIAAEKDVHQLKEEIEKLEKREYSDKEIEDKFNGK